MPDAPVKALVEDFLDTYRSRDTRDGFRRDLTHWISWCERNGVDPLRATERDTDQYGLWLVGPNHTIRNRPRSRYQAATVNRHLNALSGFCKHLVRVGEAASNPAARTRRANVPAESTTTGLLKADAITLLRVAAAADPLPAAVVSTMLLTGLRVGELCDTNLTDFVDRQDGAALNVRLKSGRPAVMTVHEPAAEAIRRWVDRRPVTVSRALFVHHGQRLPRRRVGDMLDMLTKQAGTPRVTPHGLRHTCATLMLDNGASVGDVQLQLNHLNLESTLRYDRARRMRSNAASARFANMLSGADQA